MRAKSFEFTSKFFKPKNKKAVFNYRINFYNSDSIDFTEEIFLPRVPNISRVPKKLLNNILNDLHLVLGLSYYKLYCPKKIILKNRLSKDRASFWNTLYEKGLGEFFYKNKIDYRGLVNFPFIKSDDYSSVSLRRKNRSLVGIGGGKDSIVSLELLKKDKFDIDGFVVETGKKYAEVESVLKISNLKSVKINRVIDKRLVSSNFPESFNGHVPISSIYAFLGIFSAILYDYKYIIVSNEYSSNFGNIRYLGQEINHQWSKSQEFESLLREYSRKYITGDVIYFSLLRPFYEISIAKLFTQHKKYFSTFSSCNSRYKVNKERTNKKWCGVCPKCVFVFTMLSAFIEKKELIKMFGRDLYDDKSLEFLFMDILGAGKMKPFECVGTFEESQVAFSLARNKFKDSYIIKKLASKIKVNKNKVDKVLSTHKSLNIPPEFIFVGTDKILISGYGKEGKATYKFLKNYFPKKSISIAREVDSIKYKGLEKKYDLSIKSPGIPSRKIGINYTTATNIFLSKMYGRNQVVGITGSKGKSTTASLIFSILMNAKKQVKFMGNIGTAMLSEINSVKTNDIIILELSSYQLEDIYYSPNISLVTNLFPDHMNYHGGLDPYYEAKKNIIKYQSPEDIFFYNGKNKMLSSWAKESISKVIDFSTQKYPNLITDLSGDHNISNIKAAIAISKYFNVSDRVIKDTIKDFKPLPHRMELVACLKGINFYDDAISTTPDSTIAALKAINKVQTIFLGGEDRGYDFSKLEKEILKSKIKNVVLFPDSGSRIFSKKSNLNILKTRSMKDAVRFAFKHTLDGYSCLLSCASPSYSLWKNFEEKGDEFKKCISLFSDDKKEFKK